MQMCGRARRSATSVPQQEPEEGSPGSPGMRRPDSATGLGSTPVPAASRSPTTSRIRGLPTAPARPRTRGELPIR